MNIALYSAFFSEETLQYVKATVTYLKSHGHQFTLVQRLRKHLGTEGSN